MIGQALANGKEARTLGFGTFCTRNHPARTGCNPRTGERVSIAALIVPVFKPGQTLREAAGGSYRTGAGDAHLSRRKTPEIHGMWNLTDCDTMTGTLDAAGPLAA